MTTAPAAPRTLYGPDGQALARPAADWQPVRATDNAVVWERARPVPVADPVTETRAEAEQVLAAARAEAEQITAEAKSLRTRTLAAATFEASEIRDRAASETQQKDKRGKSLDVWMARAVIAGAVGLTASGEYALARLAHFPREVAWLLPFVIDIYVIQAFRRHRDIAQAIGLTIAANVVYHLAAAGMFGVATDGNGKHHATWWLIALVASIASVILWRMHVITAPPRGRKVPAESTLTDSQETAPRVPVESESSAGESTVESDRESAGESAQVHSHRAPRESAAKRSQRRAPRRRESAPTVSSIGTPASEVAALVALMRERGSADAVTLPDARRIAANRSEATAARRLQSARTTYTNQK